MSVVHYHESDYANGSTARRVTRTSAVIHRMIWIISRALYVVPALAIALFGVVAGLVLNDGDGLFFATLCALLSACIWLLGRTICGVLGG
jgi:hypothetical protein